MTKILKVSDTGEVEELPKNVHTEHCCICHSCKYGDANCPVATGKQFQSYPCESCDTIDVGFPIMPKLNRMASGSH